MNKKIGIIFSAIIGVSLLSSFIMAFGVAIPYWDSPEWRPLKLAPGESTIVELTLQNTGEKDMIVEATITGQGIAEIQDSEERYSVPSGEINEKVQIKVAIPKDAKVGETYKIYTTFKEVSEGEGGMIAMTGAFTVNFPVEVVGKQESSLFNPSEKKSIFPWIILGTLVLGLIIIAIVKNKKKQKKK